MKTPMENAEELNNKGIALTNAGHPFEAIKVFKKALLLDPKNTVLHFNLGLAEQDAGSYDEAILSFQNAICEDPNFAEAWGSLALLYYQCSDFILAEGAYKEALKNDDENAELWNNYGALAFAQGRVYEAQECFERAVTLAPFYTDALVNLLDTYRELENYTAAACIESQLRSVVQ